MPWFYENKEESKFFAEVEAMPDRAIGTLLVTVVDTRLEKAIQAQWHDIKIDGELLSQRLFRYSGPLGSFGVRIDIGLAIGIYGGATHKDLHTMRRIRNNFAHELSHNDFSAESIAALSSNLKIAELIPISPPGEIISSGVNPSPDALVKTMLRHSSVTDINSPKNRYIRAAEILSGLLLWAANDPDRKLRDPIF